MYLYEKQVQYKYQTAVNKRVFCQKSHNWPSRVDIRVLQTTNVYVHIRYVPFKVSSLKSVLLFTSCRLDGFHVLIVCFLLKIRFCSDLLGVIIEHSIIGIMIFFYNAFSGVFCVSLLTRHFDEWLR